MDVVLDHYKKDEGEVNSIIGKMGKLDKNCVY